MRAIVWGERCFSEPFSFNSQSMLVSEHPDVQGDATEGGHEVVQETIQEVQEIEPWQQAEETQRVQEVEEVQPWQTAQDAQDVQTDGPEKTHAIKVSAKSPKATLHDRHCQELGGWSGGGNFRFKWGKGAFKFLPCNLHPCKTNKVQVHLKTTSK